MEKSFKSNIKCSACVEKVSEALNTMDTIQSWKVDLDHKDRILHVEGEASIEEINQKLNALGYEVSN